MRSLFLLIPSLFFLMCEGPSGEERPMDDASGYPEFSEMTPELKSAPRAESIQAEEDATAITNKNIKTGGMTFKSEDIDTDYKKIIALLPDFKAYVENENQTKSDQRIQYDLTIRVPSDRYDSLYNSLSNLAGRVEHKYTNVQDVTERYYDLKTRIRNKEALEQRYIDLLAKAVEIKDMLEIERQLNQVRTEIESLQGQFNYLSQQVSLSTLQLSFYELLPYTFDDSRRPGFGNRILSALSNGWKGLQVFVLGLVTIWPLYVLVAFGIFLFMVIRKQVNKKR